MRARPSGRLDSATRHNGNSLAGSGLSPAPACVLLSDATPPLGACLRVRASLPNIHPAIGHNHLNYLTAGRHVIPPRQDNRQAHSVDRSKRLRLVGIAAILARNAPRQIRSIQRAALALAVAIALRRQAKETGELPREVTLIAETALQSDFRDRIIARQQQFRRGLDADPVDKL